jgi:hypothetical protein
MTVFREKEVDVLIERCRWFVFLLFAFFSLVFLITVPVQCLVIRSSDGRFITGSPLNSRESFILEYIHSVEKTPVQSEYRVLSGKIRQWEERFLSHNAGLPTEAFHHGRFVMHRKWMILRGGGIAVERLRYRVGDEEFGKNRLFLPGGSPVRLFETHPRQVLEFSAETTSLPMCFLSRFF